MFSPEHVEFANTFAPNTMVDHLSIRFLVDAQGRLCATMPVDARTHQPAGLLHGGATAALAESLGSMGSWLLVDREKHAVVGVEINVNHLKGVRSGTVTATGELLHQGRTMHVWDIKLRNAEGHLCAVCRLTTLIIDKR